MDLTELAQGIRDRQITSRELVEGHLETIGRLNPLLHLGTTFVFAALVVLVFIRLPLAHGVLAAATLLVSVSAERLTSIERYALSAVPIVVVAAMVSARPAVERAVLPLTASAMVALAALAWLGAYTP